MNIPQRCRRTQLPFMLIYECLLRMLVHVLHAFFCVVVLCVLPIAMCLARCALFTLEIIDSIEYSVRNRRYGQRYSNVWRNEHSRMFAITLGVSTHLWRYRRPISRSFYSSDDQLSTFGGGSCSGLWVYYIFLFYQFYLIHFPSWNSITHSAELVTNKLTTKSPASFIQIAIRWIVATAPIIHIIFLVAAFEPSPGWDEFN